MTRLSVLMVVKNEANRYLEQALQHATTYANEVFVYDDQSTDKSAKIAEDYAVVAIRPSEVPSFLEHEGHFRQAALDTMVQKLGLVSGDWVHVLDADEFLMCEAPIRETIEDLIRTAEKRSSKALRVRIPSIWGGAVIDGKLYDPVIRTDEFWSTMAEPRIWQYQEGAHFLNKAMACRNEPTYVRKFPMLDAPTLFNLHYGYAVPMDRTERYERYTSLDDHGQNPRFIESIHIAAPVEKWRGPWKPVKIPQVDLTAIQS